MARQIEDGELLATETLSGGVEIHAPGRYVHLPPGQSAADFWELTAGFGCPRMALEAVTDEGYPISFS